ncbi:MAG: hypothetical protein WB817_01040 [Terriglobales bacterium]
MEALIELVAASFIRHGIESPVANSPASQSSPAGPIQATSPIDPSALPEHSYRKKPEAELAR